MRWLVRTVQLRLWSLVIPFLVVAFLLYAQLTLYPTPNFAQQIAIPQQTPAPLPPDDANWSGAFDAPFVRGFIFALAMRGNNLYVGGKFNQLGNQTIINIGKWNGESWSPLGNGFSGAPTADEVYAIAIAGSKVFVAGDFTKMGNTVVNNIVMWDETTRTWSTLGQGVVSLHQGQDDSAVNALAVSGDILYVGGTFTHAGGQQVNNIARWSISGRRWYPMERGINGRVLAMVAQNNDLYVGGEFREAGGEPVERLARWDKKENLWLSLPDAQVGDSLSDSYVSSLVLRGTELYVGGKFGAVNGKSTRNFASWNTTTGVWTTYGNIGATTSDRVTSIALSRDGKQVYVGGFFSNAGPVAVRNIARLQGTTWNPVDSASNQGTDRAVYALVANALYNDDIYVAGEFIYVNGDQESPAGIYTPAVALLSDRQWSALGQGLSCVPSDTCVPFVRSMASNGIHLYVGGTFNRAGGVKVHDLARFDGRRWEALNYANMQIEAPWVMAFLGNDLYVVAAFKVNGTAVYNSIAKYNTTSGAWSGLGAGPNNGVNGAVHALAVSEGKVYVGGFFTHAGGKESNFVAVWDGASWKPLTTPPFNGLSEPVTAMTADGSGGIYMVTKYCASNDNGNTLVGCGFVRFAGGQWQGLKYGVVPVFSAAPPAVGGGRTYFGGSFKQLVPFDNTKPMIPVNNIAAYDGSSWTPLGTPPNDGLLGQAIDALVYHGDRLYVGGCLFIPNNPDGGKNLASWGGGQWAYVGGGTNGCVSALHSKSDGLYVGGGFTQTGSRYASVINVWKRNALRNGFGPANGLGLDIPGNGIKIDIKPRTPTSLTVTSNNFTVTAHTATTDTLFLEVGEVTEPPLPLPAPHSPLRVYQVSLTDADGVPIADYDPPFSITLRYSDEELAAWNLDEATLNVLWLDAEGVWHPLLPCAECALLPEQNELIVQHDKFATFALAGEIIEPVAELIEEQQLFMPLIDQ